MYASIEFIRGELQKARMLRRCCCATAVPIFPGDVPMTADGLRANEVSDLETCHAGLLSMTRSVSVEPHDQDRARRSVNDPCGGAAEPQKLEATAPLSSNHHELRGDRFGISDDDFAR